MPQIVASPLRIPLSSKRDFILNLNNYRNLDRYALNTSKVNYNERMESTVAHLPVYTEPVDITYTLYPGTNQICDLGNVCCIHQKYFEDSMVHAGKLEDDNYKLAPISHFVFGKVDRLDPRVEVMIWTVRAKHLNDILKF